MDAIMSKSKGSGGPATSRSVTSTSSAPTSSGWDARGSMPPQHQQYSAAPSGPPQYQQYSSSSAGYRGAMMRDEGAQAVRGEKAPPSQADEMLREQANLDDVVLREAFAMAMQELVAEKECSFVAKGLCHLCGVKEKRYMPVVNFCPHANEAHSLCREHLRSIYGVRLEDLFAAKEHAVPSQRAMRCMVCTRGCPCSTCIQEKQDELTRYKRFLIAELRRSHTQPTAMKDVRPVAMLGADGRMMIPDRVASAGMAEGRMVRDGSSAATAIAVDEQTMRYDRSAVAARVGGRTIGDDLPGAAGIADARTMRDDRSAVAPRPDGRTMRDGRPITTAIANGRMMREGRSVIARRPGGRTMRDDRAGFVIRSDGRQVGDDAHTFTSAKADERTMRADRASFPGGSDGRSLGTPVRMDGRAMRDNDVGEGRTLRDNSVTTPVRSDGRTLGDDNLTTPVKADGRTMRNDGRKLSVGSDGQTVGDDSTTAPVRSEGELKDDGAAAPVESDDRTLENDQTGADAKPDEKNVASDSAAVTRTDGQTMKDDRTAFVIRANGQPVGDERSTVAEGRTMKDDQIADVERADGRTIYSSKQTGNSSESRRFEEYMPTAPSAQNRAQHDENFSRSTDEGDEWEERRKVPSQQSNHDQNAADVEGNSRDTSSNMQAQQKHPTRAPLVPKRAAKDVSPDMFSAMADKAQVADPRSAATNAPPHVRQGSVESPSAAHVLNCAESEKSLVELLSALHQNARPGSSGAMDTSTTSTFGRDHHQDVRNAKRDYEQLNSPAKSTSSYKDRSSISSMDSRGSPTPRPRPEGIAHTAVGLAPALARKRKADEGGYTGSPLVRSQAQYNGKAPVANGQNVVVKRGPGRPRKYPIDASASIARSGQKVARRKPGRPPKRKYRKRLRRAESSDDDEEADDEDEADDEKMDADGSESELDANLDFCEVCQAAGDLVCCDKCPRSFHLACLHMKESDLPEGDWQCDECKKPSRFEGYSRAVAAEQSLLDKCLKIVACLKSHPFAKPFLSPVENVPMYTRVVKQPMDLSKIEEKLKTGAYIMDTEASVAGVKALNVERFANDIRLMWSNCKLFNDDGSGITRAADQLSRGFERLFRESKQSALDSQG